MNLVATAPLWLIILLCIAFLAAAVEDGLRLRISNLTSIAVLVGAVVAAALAGPNWSQWQNGAVFLIALALGTCLFAGGWLGGGDVKLLAATGLWFDLKSALALITLILLSGGMVAVTFLIARVARGAGFKTSRKARVPYGIAIAVGAFAMIVLDSRALSHHERPLPPISIRPAAR